MVQLSITVPKLINFFLQTHAIICLPVNTDLLANVYILYSSGFQRGTLIV